MNSVKSFKKTFAGVRFSTVSPVVTFVSALIFLSILAGFFFWHAHDTSVKREIQEAERLASALSDDVEAGNTEVVERMLATFAPQGARVTTPDGRVLAGRLPATESRARVYPVMHGTQPAGYLTVASRQAFTAPAPYSVTVFLVVLFAVILAGLNRLFAGLVTSHIARFTGMVRDFGEEHAARLQSRSILFTEFKTFNLAIVSTIRRMKDEIKTLKSTAMTDARTGLLNEAALDKRLERILETATYDNPVALITLEVQILSAGYVKIGAEVTQDVVSEIVKRLKEFVADALDQRDLPEGSWLLAALPGNLFSILIMRGGARDAISAIVSELQTALGQSITVGERTLTTGLAGSIVLVPEDVASLTQIHDRARATITDLKTQKKNGLAFYSPQLERQRDARIKLESELREAVFNDRFIPLFQPKIDLSTGRICGAEALARWRLETGRLVSPSIFIELAEQTGLINGFGAQIMRKACQEAAHWNHEGHDINLAVNVSPRQFESDGLVEMILDALAKSGLPPRQLELEITESLAIQQPARVRAVLKPLRKLGIKLAVDDFGTGHSNLAVLTQFNFDVFKIDRQFVCGTPGDDQANAIVEMILSMATTLDMRIVGEGVETHEQMDFLRGKGCHIGQGFFYSPPVTAQVFRKLLKDQPFSRIYEAVSNG